MMTPLGTPFPCPSCSTRLVFKSDVSFAQVCPECLSIVHRAEVDGVPLRRAPKVREELSILRVGATGVLEAEGFEVIGRLQYFFSEGYRNHWFLLFQSGKTAWLGDWAGNYSIFHSTTYTGVAPVIGANIGESLSLGGTSLEIETKDRVKSIYWEGEVPGQGLQDQGYTSLELFNTKGQMGLVQAPGTGTPQAYLGHYLDVENLQLKGTRVHHEWL